MAVPARIFVGITLFGLMATCVTGAFSFIVLSCVDLPANSDVPDAKPACDAYSTGHKVLLVMATLFSAAFTYLAWRSLLGGARAAREARAGGVRERGTTQDHDAVGASEAKGGDGAVPREDEPPGGYA